MGLLRATDAAFPAAYPSRVARATWLPLHVTNCDLTTYPSPQEVFSDHCSMIFRVEPVDPDPVRAFIVPIWWYSLERFIVEPPPKP